jgi:hypothetical protein
VPLKPKTAVDKEVFDIWCEASPVDAFIAGRSDFAGRIFIPTRENLDAIRKRIDDVQARCHNDSQRKLLACIDTYLMILEPCNVPDYVLNSFFGYMVKEGIKPTHLIGLAEYGRKALEAYLENSKSSDWPIGQRLLAEIRCDGLLEILNVVTGNTKNTALKASVDGLLATVKEYEKRVHVDGYSTGAFDEVWKIITEQGCVLNRENVYAQALTGLYDYSESPSEVEEKGLRFLQNELGGYNRHVREMAETLGCEARSEAVTQAITKEKSLKPDKVIQYINRVRNLVVKVVNKKVVGVNPKYFTRVLETPTYLSGVLPSGAAFYMNYLTANPTQIFLATTDPRRDPHTIPSELVNLLVHEEYGHCLHSSNSARGFAYKPAFVEMLSSTLGSAISEGMSFQRELEFLDYLNQLPSQNKLTAEEKSFMRSWDRQGAFETFRREYEFFTETWRMTRFLRVIGDARINSGKQGLAEFIDWANKETGLSKSMVYFQVFPAHQGIGPGYASTYAIIGEKIREIQKACRAAGKDFVKFNTYTSSQGFTPRTIFESRLWEFVRG